MAMYDIYVSVYDVTDIYMSVTCACQDQLSVCDMYVWDGYPDMHVSVSDRCGWQGHVRWHFDDLYLGKYYLSKDYKIYSNMHWIFQNTHLRVGLVEQSTCFKQTFIDFLSFNVMTLFSQ